MTGEKNHHPTCVSCPNYTAYVVSPESMAAFPSSSSSNQDSRPPYFCIISANSPFLARSSLHAPCGCRMKCRTFLNKKNHDRSTFTEKSTGKMAHKNGHVLPKTGQLQGTGLFWPALGPQDGQESRPLKSARMERLDSTALSGCVSLT